MKTPHSFLSTSCVMVYLLLLFISQVTQFPIVNLYSNRGHRHVHWCTTRNWSLREIALDSSLPLWSREIDWICIYTILNTRYNDNSGNIGSSVPTPSRAIVPSPSPISISVPSPWYTHSPQSNDIHPLHHHPYKSQAMCPCVFLPGHQQLLLHLHYPFPSLPHTIVVKFNLNKPKEMKFISHPCLPFRMVMETTTTMPQTELFKMLVAMEKTQIQMTLMNQMMRLMVIQINHPLI